MAVGVQQYQVGVFIISSFGPFLEMVSVPSPVKSDTLFADETLSFLLDP